MSYQSAIDHLAAMAPELAIQTGQTRRKFSLEEFAVLLHALGDPHRTFPSVLIAGTNGKGSTAATLSSILTASGLRTGLYTSPHLARPNERIRIDGAEISDTDFAERFFRVRATAQKLVDDKKLAQAPSFFETLTAMAFLQFAEPAIEIAVLEVGLGGRLDATNIVDPLLSVITDISLDHMEWLGSTISEITREKAGILRTGGTLVTLPQHPEANQALGEIAMSLSVLGVSAVPYMPRTDMRLSLDSNTNAAAFAPKSGSGTDQVSCYEVDVLGETINVASPLAGAHQHRNVALAIAASVELAISHGFPITPKSIAQGIRATRWPARLERIRVENPDNSDGHTTSEWIIDVAHNPAGAWALRASLRELLPNQHLRTLIFSCLRDKPVAEMAQILFPLFDEIIFAPINSTRATPMRDLLAAAASTGTPAVAASSVSQAIDLALEHNSSSARGPESTGSSPYMDPEKTKGAAFLQGPIVVSGSVYLVGDIRTRLFAMAAEASTSRQINERVGQLP